MERNAELKQFARKLRKNQTKEERLLWNAFLSKHPMRFRRQYTIGNYIVDFFCHAAMLAVELDGSQHYGSDGMEQDRARTTYLESQGVMVLRFSNLDVMRQFKNVCAGIDRIAESRAGLDP